MLSGNSSKPETLIHNFDWHCSDQCLNQKDVFGIGMCFTHLILSPPSSIWWFNPSGNVSTKDLRLECSKADQRDASSKESVGSRLNLKDPEKSTGSCGMTVIFWRRSWRPMVEISTSSRIICPPAASTIRNRERAREDFPAPVRPTTPILWPGAMFRLRPCEFLVFGREMSDTYTKDEV